MLVAFLLPITIPFITVYFDFFGDYYFEVFLLSSLVSIIISIYDWVRRKKLGLGLNKIAIIPAVIYSLIIMLFFVFLAPVLHH